VCLLRSSIMIRAAPAARCGGAVRRRPANRCASVLCGAGCRRGVDRRRAYRSAGPRQCEFHAGDDPAGVLGRAEAAEPHRAERAHAYGGLIWSGERIETRQSWCCDNLLPAGSNRGLPSADRLSFGVEKPGAIGSLGEAGTEGSVRSRRRTRRRGPRLSTASIAANNFSGCARTAHRAFR
jgi:hypothetical protein